MLAFCDIEESTALLALALINVFPDFAMIVGMMSASTIYHQNGKSQEIAHQATYDWSPILLTQKNSQSDARSTSTPVEGSSRSTTSGSPINANASVTSHYVKETKGQGHNSRKEPDPKLIETSCPRCATVSLRLIYYRHYH